MRTKRNTEKKKIPVDDIKETFYREYIQAASVKDADFDQDVEKETKN